MPLTDRLKEDLTRSLKNGMSVRVGVLRFLLSEIYNKTKERFGAATQTLSDEDALAVLQKEAKKRREATELFKKGAREDLVKKEGAELKIVEEFLPKAMTQGEIKTTIRGLRDKGHSDFNALMKEAMKELKGKADGRLVGEIIKEILANESKS